MTTTETPAQRTTPAPRPSGSPRSRLCVLTNGSIASVRHNGRWYLLNTGPEVKSPVLRLAGDADDAGLEPHICRSID
ncbi:hypothetical protein ACIHAA_21355 [Streptomyces sp. NPDC052040]|uniref:hypothetical protein n=1 Tax=unclassified Streptomyces TaxID=2593676 RepID=UPI0037D72C7E